MLPSTKRKIGFCKFSFYVQYSYCLWLFCVQHRILQYTLYKYRQYRYNEQLLSDTNAINYCIMTEWELHGPRNFSTRRRHFDTRANTYSARNTIKIRVVGESAEGERNRSAVQTLSCWRVGSCLKTIGTP